MKKLSIIIPLYNEQNTIYDVLKKVESVQLLDGIQKQIIVVNDKSTDNSASEVERYLNDYSKTCVEFYHNEVNKGKGGALHNGFSRCVGEYIIIQDADLELNPDEFNILLKPVLDGVADIVYGSRFLTERKEGAIISIVANKVLTVVSNIVFRTKITDMETCYKLMPTELVQRLNLVEQRFGFEPEVTAKLAKERSLRWTEVPITYEARTSEEGKKIGWKDGFRALYCILKYGWFTSKKSSFRD